MKAAASAVTAYLNGFRPKKDGVIYMADIYKITLAAGSAQGIASGTTITVTSLDVPILSNGLLYLANSLLVDGLKYKAECGLNVDTQKIQISAWESMTFAGAPFLEALRIGLFDGAEIVRSRVFFTTFSAVPPLIPIGDPSGEVILFKGRVTEIESVGRATANVTVASDLTLIAKEMPRRRFLTSCGHVLGDSNCTVNLGSYTTAGTMGSGSSTTVLQWTGALANQAQGSIKFTSGANIHMLAAIKTASAGSTLTLAYPLPSAPAAGDAFTVTQGCDHTYSTCGTRFGNQANYGGFPFLPAPEIITGPLSAQSTGGKG